MNDKRKRVRTLYTLWAAYFAANGIYALLPYFITLSWQRHPEPNVVRHDPLVGLLTFLPLALPLVLLPIGLHLWNTMLAAKPDADYRRHSQQAPDQIPYGLQTGLVLMVSIYEANTLIGALCFFLGAPLMKFLLFVIGTACLMLVALQKLIAALGR